MFDMNKLIHKNLKKILFIVLNFVVFANSYLCLEMFFLINPSLSKLIVILLGAFFIFYSFIVFKKITKTNLGVLLSVFIIIMFIMSKSESIKLAFDEYTCLDFGGRWNYEQNKCEDSRVEALNK